MKKIALLPAFFIFQILAAQNVGIGTTTPNTAAALDITSANKGLLIPRMTTAVRTGIAAAPKGLIVMDTTTISLWYYDGAAWQEGIATNNTVWTKNGNDIYNTNLQNVGIGTNTPNANALLHINTGASTTKGFLVNGTYNGSSTIPDLGAGSRMMFYPGKAAFRAGSVSGPQWDNSNVGLYSIAMGYNTTASGYYSTAMGQSTTASGPSSTAMGGSDRKSVV